MKQRDATQNSTASLTLAIEGLVRVGCLYSALWVNNRSVLSQATVTLDASRADDARHVAKCKQHPLTWTKRLELDSASGVDVTSDLDPRLTFVTSRATLTCASHLRDVTSDLDPRASPS